VLFCATLRDARLSSCGPRSWCVSVCRAATREVGYGPAHRIASHDPTIPRPPPARLAVASAQSYNAFTSTLQGYSGGCNTGPQVFAVTMSA